MTACVNMLAQATHAHLANEGASSKRQVQDVVFCHSQQIPLQWFFTLWGLHFASCMQVPSFARGRKLQSPR